MSGFSVYREGPPARNELPPSLAPTGLAGEVQGTSAYGEWGYAEWEDREDGRLPLSTAFPLILLLSLSSWALLITVALWLARVVG